MFWWAGGWVGVGERRTKFSTTHDEVNGVRGDQREGQRDPHGVDHGALREAVCVLAAAGGIMR